MALERNGLINLGWINQKCTWSNRHIDDTFTKERLDRVVANSRWLSNFSNPKVEVLHMSRSGHCPIFLTNDNIRERRRRWRIFRYEAKWVLEEDGEHTIKLAYQNRTFSSNFWSNLQSKLFYRSKEPLK